MKNLKKIIIPFLIAASACMSSCGESIDPEPDVNVDVSKHENITLNCVFPSFGHSNDKIQNGALANLIREATTYKADFNQLSEAGADTEINQILSTKEPVDMLKCAPTVFNNYVTGGYFTNLTPLIEKYGNTIVDSYGTKFVDLFSKEQWEACTYNGKIYAIPEFGHSVIASQALVWNKDHLTKVGITKIPETLTEFDTAVHALQNYFGKENQNYHAFGLTGNIAQDNTISPAFGVPMQWYEDNDGNLQHMLFSNEMQNYMKYMNGLRRSEIIVSDWVGQSESNAIMNFTKELCSVYCGSYWNIKGLRESLVGSYKSFPSDVKTDAQKKDYVHGSYDKVSLKDDCMVSWRVTLKGDGSFNSKVQEQGMWRDSRAISFFVTVPVACAKRSAYVVDWVIKKNSELCTSYVVAGKEGVHYTNTTSDDPKALKLLSDTPRYVKKEDAFDTDICGMEQFQTGLNGKVARQYFPISEAGFDAWNILVVDEKGEEMLDRVILNPFGVHPVIESFSKYDLKAQNESITKVQYCINAKTDEAFDTRVASSRDTYKTKYYDKFSADINAWYKSKDK